MSRHAAITGIGSYLPETVLTNAELERMVSTSDEWIVTRTGIKERRIASPEDATSHLGARAGAAAIKDAGIAAGDIDLLIVGTSSPDHVFPSAACLIQDQLGLSCAAYDINAACTSFIYALQSGVTAIESGRAQRVLVIGADTLTRYTDFTDRATCVLFGDGAGAVVLELSDEPGVMGIVIGADGSGRDMLIIPSGGSATPITHESLEVHDQYIKMVGSDVFKFAVRIIPNVTREALEASGLTIEDLDWLIPHQANQRIISAAAERLDMPLDRVISNVETTGNTSSGSIPLALDDLYTSGRIARGDTVAFVGFGAGLTWGAAIVRWTKTTPNK
ncbi:MAG: ketoacyl-ACP synthase III, partial [Actinomycetota bacterium]|nr:ketoacyl-ACP synthase III [Actinomycetota bacterium]